MLVHVSFCAGTGCRVWPPKLVATKSREILAPKCGKCEADLGSPAGSLALIAKKPPEGGF